MAVYVENAGFGATFGVPIGSLIIEKYLRGEISPARKGIEERMLHSSTIASKKDDAKKGDAREKAKTKKKNER